MERQAVKLDSISKLENAEKFPSAADVIKKLEIMMEKLTKENQELLNLRGNVSHIFWCRFYITRFLQNFAFKISNMA